MDTNITIDENTEGRVMCVVSGDPLPDMSWGKGDTEWGDGYVDDEVNIRVQLRGVFNVHKLGCIKHGSVHRLFRKAKKFY